MGDKTKIDWCDATWNPVTGCFHGCEYCYAWRITNRFGLLFAPKLGDPGMEGAKKYDSYVGMDTMLELEKPYKKGGRIQPFPMAFFPTFHRYRLDIPKHWTKPRNIFVCSMADLFGEWVPDEWIKDVFDACAAAPQHRYLFLTKNPQRYRQLLTAGLLPRTIECWWGASTPHKADKFNIGPNAFVSIEPILEDFTMATQVHASWVIIGAETGNRRNKVVPKRDWIMPFVEMCDQQGTPVFMKESLREIMGADFRQEFPWGEV